MENVSQESSTMARFVAGSATSASTSAMLWGHLLHKKPIKSQNLKPPASSQIIPPMAPVDKGGASVRMLLHDTQAALEKFSARVDKLNTEVQDARKEVLTAHKVFQHGQEKLQEDQVDLINRCQTQIQKSVEKPAQASQLDLLHQESTVLHQKIEALDRRVDALHMLNQTQLQALQTVQEQQANLITLLAPVTPLLQNIIDSAKHRHQDSMNEITNFAREIRETISLKTNDATSKILAAVEREDSRTPSCGELSLPRKRRKVDQQSLKSSVLLQSSPPNHFRHAKHTSARVSDSASSSSSLSSEDSPGTPAPRLFPSSPIILRPSDLLDDPISRPVQHENEAALNTKILAPRVENQPDTDNAFHPLRQPPTYPSSSAEASISLATPPSPSSDMPMLLDHVSPYSAAKSTQKARSPSDRTPALSFTSCPLGRSQSDKYVSMPSLPLPSKRLDAFLEQVRPSCVNIDIDNAGVPGDIYQDGAHLSAIPMPEQPLGSIMAPAFTTEKPMSLKDRRARGLLADASVLGSEKRFISVDELDEDEFVGELI